MADDYRIEIIGLDRITAALKNYQDKIDLYLGQAGDESAKLVLRQPGLKKYPPATAANKPPFPYYIRGRGTQTKTRNLGNSEKYGTRFYTAVKGREVTVGNSASYAKWLAGDTQAAHMGRIGWRKLSDVVNEKLPEIRNIYQKWVNKLAKDMGL